MCTRFRWSTSKRASRGACSRRAMTEWSRSAITSGRKKATSCGRGVSSVLPASAAPRSAAVTSICSSEVGSTSTTGPAMRTRLAFAAAATAAGPSGGASSRRGTSVELVDGSENAATSVSARRARSTTKPPCGATGRTLPRSTVSPPPKGRRSITCRSRRSARAFTFAGSTAAMSRTCSGLAQRRHHQVVRARFPPPRPARSAVSTVASTSTVKRTSSAATFTSAGPTRAVSVRRCRRPACSCRTRWASSLRSVDRAIGPVQTPRSTRCPRSERSTAEGSQRASATVATRSAPVTERRRPCRSTRARQPLPSGRRVTGRSPIDGAPAPSPALGAMVRR